MKKKVNIFIENKVSKVYWNGSFLKRFKENKIGILIQKLLKETV